MRRFHILFTLVKHENFAKNSCQPWTFQVSEIFNFSIKFLCMLIFSINRWVRKMVRLCGVLLGISQASVTSQQVAWTRTHVSKASKTRARLTQVAWVF